MRHVLVVSFGGQYAHLIARRIRDLGVYSEVVPYFKATVERMRAADAVVLSGGPSSVYQEGAPTIDVRLEEVGRPILGICYGFQLMAKLMGGEVKRGNGEYGPTKVRVEDGPLFRGWGREELVWMSHSDYVSSPPPGFRVTAVSENGYVAAFQHERLPLYGVQFHPEVTHTRKGRQLLNNFLELAGAQRNWSEEMMVKAVMEEAKRQTEGCGHILTAVSGGVDSTVATLVVKRVSRSPLTAVLVNHGLMRKGEPEEALNMLRKLGIDVVYVDASEDFLKALRGVKDCEEKRRIIGRKFIEVFRESIKGISFDCLVQGTLYPDVIESGAEPGADRIKSHHNVAGLPEDLDVRLVEPLRFLYKDEVRKLGSALGLPREVVMRHPFPGPGLAVRVMGEVTSEKLEIVREASHIVEEELKRAGVYEEVWQAFAAVGDDKWVGVKGDARAEGYVATVRIVVSEDAMTADWYRADHDLMDKIAKKIGSLEGVTMVTYAISTKPPSTIEPC